MEGLANSMDRQKVKQFWDRKSKKYPRPFSEKTDLKVLEVIERLEKAGVIFLDQKVLEIGCGTGVYSLPIAQKASYVCGIDCSEEMARILKEEAQRKKIENIEIQIGFWDEIDIDALGFRKKFDVILAMMTSAISSKEDILKMEECSTNWLCYIGWGRKRENPLMKEVLEIHGLELKPPLGAKRIYEILQDLGRIPYIEFFEDFWEWEGSIEEGLEDLSGFIEMQGGFPERERILQILHRYSKNGTIKHTTYVEEGLIIWRVKE
ncbi:MAG: class I SAM-dependent methyltransferase [Thermodesulfobacteriota bacterium]